MTLPHFDEPKSENERLLNLQYEYKHGRAEALGEMYEALFLIAKKTGHAGATSARQSESRKRRTRQRTS